MPTFAYVRLEIAVLFVEALGWWRLNQPIDDFESKQFQVRYGELGLGMGSVLACILDLIHNTRQQPLTPITDQDPS